MIFDPKIFYQVYQKDYHRIKAAYIKHYLNNLELYHEKLYGDEKIDPVSLKDFKNALKSDLRQTYFHAIETFFELFFALNPKDKEVYDDHYILFNLTNSNWSDNYRKINEFANDPKKLRFLNDQIVFMDYKISIGHYIFYMGLFSEEKFPAEFFKLIDESIEAIIYGVEIIAKDFAKKEEYNSYKHGLRIIPASKSFAIKSLTNPDLKLEWDVSESMSFYLKTKDPDEISIITKLFDTDRDIYMINFCSNLIDHMIGSRKVTFNKEWIKDKDFQYPVSFFGKEEIEKCNKINVAIQDLKFTSRRTKKETD